MAKICPMKGCKNESICMHDKIMLVVLILVVLAILGRVFNLF